MRCWILLIACLGAWCAVAVAADSRPNAKEANELIKQLRELEKDGRYSEMVRPTARLVDIVRQIKGESSAEYAKWLGFQGAIHVAIGDYENAEKSLRSAVEVFQKVRRPLNKETRIMMVDARVELATVLLAIGKLADARDELNTALGAESDGATTTSQRVLVRFQLGVIEYQMGNRNDARKSWRETKDLARQNKSDDPLLKLVPALCDFMAALEDDKQPSGNVDDILKELTESPSMKPLAPKLLLIMAAEAEYRGDLDTARTLLLKALGLQRALTGLDHPDNAPILSGLASVERESMNLDQAEHYFEEQERILGRAPDEGNLKLADALIEHGSFLLLRGDSSGARRLVERACRILAPVLPPDNINWAEALHLKAQLAESQGDLDEAERMERRVLKLRGAQYPREHRIIADSLKELAQILVLEGDLSEAEPLINQSLSNLRKVLPAGDRELIFALIATARFQQSKGDMNQARTLLKEALDSIPSGLFWSDAMRALVRVQIATSFMIQVNPTAAEPYFRDSQEEIEHVHRLLKSDRLRAELSDRDGQLLLLRGDCVSAQSALRSALGLYQELGMFHPETVSAAVNLSAALRCSGDYDGAKALLQPIRNELVRSGRQKVLQAMLGTWLGLLLIDMGDDRAAEPLLRDAIRILKDERGNTYIYLANLYVNLGDLRSRAGDQEEAIELWSEAEKIVKLEGDPGSPIVAHVRLARAEALLGSTTDAQAGPEAVRLATEALDLIRTRFGAEATAGADALRVLAMAKWSLGDLDGARSALRDKEKIVHMNGFPKDRSAAELAFSAVLQRKGTVQDLVAEQARIERNAGEARPLITLWKQKERAVAACAATDLPLSLVGGPHIQDSDCAKRILGLESDAGDARQQVLEKVPSLAVMPVKLSDLALRLRQEGGFALVEIVQYQSFRPRDPQSSSRYAAYVLLPNEQVKWVDLGEQGLIDQRVAGLRRVFSGPTSKLRDAYHAARELDKLVMEPVRPLLGGIKRLFVSPDGDLNLVDFSSLIDETGKFLIDSYAISGLTSGRDLLRLAREPQRPNVTREDHVFANPSFRAIVDSSSTAVASGRMLGTTENCNQAFQMDWPSVDFPVLLDQLRTAMPGVKVHDREKASKHELAAIHAPHTIWFLTHGFFCVSQESDQFGRLVSSTRQNPMDRAALVLAGASTADVGARRNGYVTAREISQFAWDDVELVVLGACETALGTPHIGDGVYGLRRALAISGVRSQVMTLWSVDPGMTAKLLGDFAIGLSQGEGRLFALREAQRKIRRAHPHPYYWAGIFFMGETGSIEVSLATAAFLFQ